MGVVPLTGVAQGEPPACVRATIALTTDVDSAHARPGDTFRFRTVEAARALSGIAVAAGTDGLGVVAIANHAERGGRGGYVVIETRYLALTDGTHVPVTIDWASASRAAATGSSQNIPGIVSAVPLVGYVLGPYGFIHHGKDVTIAQGTKLPVIVGDEAAAGACRVVPPSPAPSTSPIASPQPSPRASSQPSPGASSQPSPGAAPQPSPSPSP